MRVGILGLGHLGEAIARGLLKRKGFDVSGTVRDADKAKRLARALKMKLHTDNVKLLQRNTIILLAVKPKDARATLEILRPHFTRKHLLISVCAGLPLAKLREWSGCANVIRAMPNTPCFVGAGMTLLHAPAGTPGRAQAEKIFGAVGLCQWLRFEDTMHAGTALSACGPAYVYLIAEALIEAGEKAGLSPLESAKLTQQTLLGATLMMEHSGRPPKQLRQEVATPGGVTEQGLLVLQKRGLEQMFSDAIAAAAAKSRELSQ